MAKTTSLSQFTRLFILSSLLTFISISILLMPKLAYAGGTVTDCTNDADLHDKLAGGGVVMFACGSSPVTISLTTVDDSSASHISITQTTTISGDGLITLRANGSDRIFYVDGSQLSLDGLTLSHGRAFTFTGPIHSAGGAVFVVNGGAVTITNSTLTDNQAEFGGAVRFYDGGQLVVKNSSFIDNLAEHAGGAILVESQTGASPMTTVIINSALISNTVVYSNPFGFGNGGAIGNFNGTLTLVNSTLAHNSALEGGAIIINRGVDNSAFITNTTIVSNSASLGGGILAKSGSFNNGSSSIKNTIIAHNVADTGPNCAEAKLTSNGNNIASDNSCDFNASGDLSNTDPLLGPLANNGGDTLTHAPLPGSPAINAADNTACAANPINNVDQRGILRPQGANCDIGAVEANTNLTFVKNSIKLGENPIQPGDTLTYTIFITNTGSLTATGGVISDSLPVNTSFVPGSLSLNPEGAGSVGTIPPTLASGLIITPNQSVSVSYAVTVNSPLPDQTQIVNTASLVINEVSEPLTSTVTDTVTTPVLSIMKRSLDANGGLLQPGERITYTIIVTNTGNLTATGGLIFDPVPDHTTFVPNSISLDPPGAGLKGSTPPMLANNLTLANGESVTVTYAVTVDLFLPNLTPIVNTVSITSNEISIPQTSTITDTVTSAPTLSIQNTSQDINGGSLEPGDTLSYTIVVTNTGNLTATGGLISNPVPAHTTFVPNSISLNPPGAGLKGSTPPTLASGLTIGVGESLTVTYAVIVNSPLPNLTIITNTSSITSNEVIAPVTAVVTNTVISPPRAVFLPVILRE